MAEPRLGPDELDRLEDALEGLEALEDLRDPSQAVSSRLADFQLILQASREALPLEDVRPGLLDGVISEARMSAPDISTPTPEPAQTQSFWARMRKAWLVPGLAVAGSAALVLILVKPMVADDVKLEDAGAVAAKDTPSPAPQSDAKTAAVPAAELAQEKDSASGSKPVAGKAASDSAPPPPPAAAAPVTTRSSVEQREAPAAPAPEPAPEMKPQVPSEDAAEADLEPAASEKGWNAIEQGDSAREGGDCFSARNHYARALDDGNDSVRARAYVGMGLCKSVDGNTAAADEYFDKARELDEDAVKFADTRSKDEPAKPSSRRPRKKASGKRKSSMEFDEAMDPFQGK